MEARVSSLLQPIAVIAGAARRTPGDVQRAGGQIHDQRGDGLLAIQRTVVDLNVVAGGLGKIDVVGEYGLDLRL